MYNSKIRHFSIAPRKCIAPKPSLPKHQDHGFMRVSGGKKWVSKIQNYPRNPTNFKNLF